MENTDVITGKSVIRSIIATQGRTHEELEAMLGVEHRYVHDYIHALKEDGELIINLQDGKGYRIPSKTCKADVEDVKQYRNQEYSRERNIHLAVALADQFLGEVGA